MLVIFLCVITKGASFKNQVEHISFIPTHTILYRSKHGFSYMQELNGVHRITEEVPPDYLSLRIDRI